MQTRNFSFSYNFPFSSADKKFNELQSQFVSSSVMKLSLNYFSICAVIAFVAGQHIADNPCPNRPIEQNFDIVKVK